MSTQEEQRGWRIQDIPYCEEHQKLENNYMALFCALGFVVGVFTFVATSSKYPLIMVFAIASLLFAFVAIFLKARRKRSDWQLVSAKCLDTEIRKMINSQTAGSSWFTRVLCEYEIGGKRYQVTPAFWRSYRSLKKAQSMFDNTINGAGFCELYVNPSNPLQTELVINDIKNFLLH